MRAIAHVTLITAGSDRRIMGRVGARFNLCGGDLTDRDMTLADVTRTLREGRAAEFNLCVACVAEALTNPGLWRTKAKENLDEL